MFGPCALHSPLAASASRCTSAVSCADNYQGTAQATCTEVSGLGRCLSVIQVLAQATCCVLVVLVWLLNAKISPGRFQPLTHQSTSCPNTQPGGWISRSDRMRRQHLRVSFNGTGGLHHTGRDVSITATIKSITRECSRSWSMIFTNFCARCSDRAASALTVSSCGSSRFVGSVHGCEHMLTCAPAPDSVTSSPLRCAEGYHGTVTLACTTDKGTFAFSGCSANECT